MERLPRDIFTECVSFLWIRDVDSLGCCSRAMSRKVKEGPHVYSPMLVRLMMAINRMKIHRASDLESTARELVARAVHWPMSMDHRQLPEDIALGITSDKQQFTYHFCGDHLGGNRVLCADMHFPFRASNAVRPMWIIGDGSKFIQSAFPFTKPCVVNAALTCRLSCVAYFEVTFGAVALHIQDRNSSSRSYGRFNRRPCMSVGLVNPRSSLHDRMPGWDSFSYGYHGDDGNYFHGSGTGVRFGPTFGEGDIVGCGVIYPPLVSSPPVLFFVKNGVFVHSITLATSFLSSPWFPAVGVDSFAEISVNFGTSPFLFDIIEFENKQIEKRHRIATTDVPETETAYESSTPRGLNWAFESFYREEISLADELVSGAASIEMLRDYYSHAAYHEERIVWRPNMLTSVDLSRAENLMLQCNQLLSDKAGLGFVMHELIDVLTPSRMQAYISRINSTQPNTTEFLMNFLVQGILPENLHNEPVDIFNPIYSDSESDSDYEYMEDDDSDNFSILGGDDEDNEVASSSGDSIHSVDVTS